MTPLHSLSSLEPLRKELRLAPHELKRAQAALYRTFRGKAGALEEIPEAARATFEAQVKFHFLELAQRRDSQLDGASKLLFHTEDRKAIETVILRAKNVQGEQVGSSKPGRVTLCVSSQTACAVGCVFCATGRLKGLRDLSTSEILDQVVQAGEILRAEGRTPRNVVFMGMGEPLHNEDAVFGALRELGLKGACHLSDRHLLVSTAGIPEGMVRLATEFPLVGLALSLHSARQDVRAKLVPMGRKHSLEDLRQAVQEVNAMQDRDVMIEYLMFDGLTDTDEDLAALKAWLGGLKVHVNLIPFNAIEATPGVKLETGLMALVPSRPERFKAFFQDLKESGFQVTRRYSLGADIAAACGQLARTEQ